MQRIDLPSGAWVDIKEPEELTNGDRIAYEGILDGADLDSRVGRDLTGAETMAWASVGWSVDKDPITGTRLLEVLSLSDYNAFNKITDGLFLSYAAVMFPDYTPSPDTSSPTGPSTGSGSGAREPSRKAGSPRENGARTSSKLDIEPTSEPATTSTVPSPPSALRAS